MKKREKLSGVELSTICRQLKMESSDGKKYETDCTDTEGLLRIIQSIPSPKAEPFKQWLAKTGYERIEESQDPELSIDRAMENYLRLGYSENWINQRLKSLKSLKCLKGLLLVVSGFLARFALGLLTECKRKLLKQYSIVARV